MRAVRISPGGFWRALGWLVLSLVVLVVVVSGAGFVWLRSSLPRTSGTLRLSGLGAPVRVLRDQHAVPHIYADTATDAYFALGFVHAQDRLWQMEFQRRVGAGRLAEVVGEAALPTDLFLRTLGVYHYAERTLANLSDEAVAALEAYSAGVNAFLTRHRGALPPEFVLFRHRPEPWHPADSLVWMKMMAWDMGGNWTDEVLRTRLARFLPPDEVAALWPPYPGDAPVTLPKLAVVEGLEDLWHSARLPLPEGSGSNNWVLSGDKTASGLPLLANDPHLGLSAPSVWYMAHLTAPGLNVIGATLPGLPFVVLGRTERLAWGFTNTGPDVQDLFIERLDPDDPGRYLTPDGSQPFATRREVVRVRGGEAHVLEVRESRHGPILSDVSAALAGVSGSSTRQTPDEHVLAFAWTALRDDDLSIQGGLALNRAQNWGEFVAAMRDFHAPQQNIVYADTDGNIGFYAPARVPVRTSGDGRAPVPGWTGEHDWQGFIPFDELPHALNPAAGQIVTANHKIVPDDYPHFITFDWADPYRAERIETLLAQTERHSLDTLAAIQADQTSGMAAAFLPTLRALTPQSEQAERALALLEGWDARMDRTRPEPLIFAAWYREFSRLLFEPRLHSVFRDFWGFRPRLLQDIMDERPGWCNNWHTPRIERCDEVALQALETALTRLQTSYGRDMSRWRWGEAHTARHPHNVLSNTPLARFVDLTTENGGDAFTVNAARYDLTREPHFTQTGGVSYRALYDLADLDRSRFILATGQSGNPLSSHYRDFLEPWRDVRYLPLSTDPATIAAGEMHILTLLPE